MSKKFDVIVIGGGAAGLMAAISAKKHHPDFSVLLLEKSFALGRKVLVSGAGRCNLTNKNLAEDPLAHFHSTNEKLINNVFKLFSYKKIIQFFEDLGLPLVPDRKGDAGKIFPASDSARSVVGLLTDELRTLGVEVRLESEVESLVKKEQFQIKIKNSEKITSRFLILTTGGRTYPALGSDGAGYDWLKSFGHKIVEPIPAAVALEAKNPLSQALQGVKLPAEVAVLVNGKIESQSVGDVLFTKYGLSGSAILAVSRAASVLFNRDKQKLVTIKLNFFPGKHEKAAAADLKEIFAAHPRRPIEKVLMGFFPPKFPAALLRVLGLDPAKQARDLSGKEFARLIDALMKFEVLATATRGWNEAEFTAGGVDAREIDEETLESKKVNGLYFAGEIIDVDGDIGGYNLSWAWSSGLVAGKLG
jgi:hypothetical protein